MRLSPPAWSGLVVLLCAAMAAAQAGSPPSLNDRPRQPASAPPTSSEQPAGSAPEAAALFGRLDNERLAALAPAPGGDRTYRIGPGDEVEVQVLRHPEFHARGRVSSSGALPIPILGEVAVSGLSATELDTRLTDLIGRDYLVDPDVLVTITDYENMKIYITGSVQEPGVHKLNGPVTLLELLSTAGGFDERHAQTITIERSALRESEQDGRKLVVRDTETLSVDLQQLLHEGDLSQNVMLQNGDKIYVPPDDARIYVFGEVNSPGFFPYQEEMTLYEGIRLAGGFTDFANPKKIKIRRRADDSQPDEPRELRVNLKAMIKDGDISANVPLKDGDVVIVGSSFFF